MDRTSIAQRAENKRYGLPAIAASYLLFSKYGAREAGGPQVAPTSSKQTHGQFGHEWTVFIFLCCLVTYHKLRLADINPRVLTADLSGD